ncbi:MAG: glycoside hydrolase family 25 protein [Bacilli bacterium]|nr:glycoside hydrolase family 25 protein [Bacilli bacterium]
MTKKHHKKIANKKKVNKKKVSIIISCIIGVVILIILIYYLIGYIRVKNAKVEVKLVDNLKLEFNEKVYVSDLITSINGKIIDDYEIDTTKVGEHDITFHFINDENIELGYTFEIEVVDNVAPVIWLGNSYNIAVNSDIDLTKKILCGDNIDEKPKCEVVGEYDLTKIGKYNLVFKAKDKSGNETNKDFVLNVYEPTKSNNNTTEIKYLDYHDVYNNYKNDKTKIGIDVSKWQGDIDFTSLKDSGVEFVMIKLGGYQNGEYYVDSKFVQNIKAANELGIDVGVYFYSQANSVKQAKKDAEWVLDKLEDYYINMPVAFDWEEWANFNDYNLSFFGLTSVADKFLKTVKNDGYDVMLYSSKNYLDNIWLPIKYDIWLAQYTKNPTYEGQFKMWQRTDKGKVKGIKGAVDIDIYYN